MTGKALSVKQPWGEAIVRGLKDVENRTWYVEHRGPLYIHASKGIDEAGFTDILKISGVRIQDHELTLGALIGIVELLDIVQDSPSPWAIRGRYHWLLGGARRLQRPIYCRGQLGIWDPSPKARRRR